jgi:peptidyl-prolyl cis-trans isomerase C
MKRAVIASAMLLAISVAGGTAQAQTGSSAAADDPVAATVNGQPIAASDVQLFYESLPPQYRQIPIEQIRDQLVERLIEQRLVADAARAAGMMKRPDVRKRIDMATQGMLNEIFFAERINAEVTDARVREEYQKSIAFEPKREEVRARHILVKTREAAVAIITEIRGGADFAEVARQKSTGPSSRNGGDLGFFAQEQMVPAFSKVAFALKPGEVTDEPVQTQFGWHIIKVEERRISSSGGNFEEASEKIRQEMSEKVFRETIAELRTKAKIEITGGGGSKIRPVQ